jgi:glutamate synthase (NADPH/NADH) large chain
LAQDHNLSRVLDRQLIVEAAPALTQRQPVRLRRTLRNSDRALGAMLSGECARRFGAAALPTDTITIDLTGSAGQSFGAFATAGLTLNLCGDANDYVGKSLSGGILAIRPPPESPFVAAEQVIVGNTVLYGAIAGQAFFNGRAGERFAVRNSGVIAVVEGIGDHGCEYMTGGVVLVLGPTGRNFAAGMSGGVAVVLDDSGELRSRCHPELGGALSPLLPADLELVTALLHEHRRRTGSVQAASLLASVTPLTSRLVKLVPPEYRRALAAAAAPPSSLAAALALGIGGSPAELLDPQVRHG